MHNVETEGGRNTHYCNHFAGTGENIDFEEIQGDHGNKSSDKNDMVHNILLFVNVDTVDIVDYLWYK